MSCCETGSSFRKSSALLSADADIITLLHNISRFVSSYAFAILTTAGLLKETNKIEKKKQLRQLGCRTVNHGKLLAEIFDK